jgi:hypothetical protein
MSNEPLHFVEISSICERLAGAVRRIEALLAELEIGDLPLPAPPPQVWAAVEQALAASGRGLSVAGGTDDLELWLIEPDATGAPADVAPVAVLGADGGGVYPLPEPLDPRSHYVVDISIEPRDGNPAHSGDSILRGALDTG